jgi:hypothetical protein
MKYLQDYKLFESKSNIKFIKKDKRKKVQRLILMMCQSGTIIGQVKWSSRMRGYAFLPTADSETEIKSFVKELMDKRREDKEFKVKIYILFLI